MKKRICALLLCLTALFSLAGCGTKPKTPVKGQNEPNPVKAQGLPEAEPGCVPLLLIYTCGEPGSQVFQYYSATWNIQRNTLTQGQLFYTGTSYGFVPDGWRQERATFDGQSFTYIREGQGAAAGNHGGPGQSPVRCGGRRHGGGGVYELCRR